jgi:uncharacterized membrane protein
MTILLSAFALGVLSGLRAMMPLAAVSWGARLGYLDLSTSGLAFLGYTWTPWVLTVFALGELVTDQLPSTPSRTVPVQFGARLLTGGLSGAAVGLAHGNVFIGAAAGVVGAVAGTLGGRAFRGWLAGVFGQDPPAAFIEDAIAIAGTLLVVFGLS